MKTESRFEMAGGGHPLLVLDVEVNDLGPFSFVLDTGASTTLLTPQLADRLGVVVSEYKEARGAGGNIRIGTGSVQSVSIGEARVSDLEVGITDEMSRIGEVIGTKLDGNLGFNFLKHFSIGIDYSVSKISFGEGEPEPAGAVPFEVAADGKALIIVESFLNGEGPFNFVLDTGASGTVVSTQLADKLGIAKKDEFMLTGGGGKASGYLAQIDRFAVGHVEIALLNCAVVGFLADISEKVGRELFGIVGYNFLKNFRVTIDYPGFWIDFAEQT